jgi:hypothetical protein
MLSFSTYFSGSGGGGIDEKDAREGDIDFLPYDPDPWVLVLKREGGWMEDATL